jgi:predicted RNA-binding protein with PIN domain
MHLESGLRPAVKVEEPSESVPIMSTSTSYRGTLEEDKELQAIYERTYGAVKRKEFIPRKADVIAENHKKLVKTPFTQLPEYLLVDGYNIIFAWDELKALAAESLAAARQSLADILSNYQGYRKCGVILVFDAYKVKGNTGSVEKYRNIHIVYTKEAETADAYIEKASYDMRKQYRVRVATSDGMEQLIILGHGASRVSATAFQQEVLKTHTEIREIVQKYHFRAQKGSSVGEMLKKK